MCFVVRAPQSVVFPGVRRSGTTASSVLGNDTFFFFATENGLGILGHLTVGQ